MSGPLSPPSCLVVSSFLRYLVAYFFGIITQPVLHVHKGRTTSGRRRRQAPRGRAMSALGQSRRFGDVRASSALALKADIHHKARHVSKVPKNEPASAGGAGGAVGRLRLP